MNLFCRRKTEGAEYEFIRIKPCLSSVISKWEPLVHLALRHDPPSLLGEWYRITAVIKNDEPFPATELLITSLYSSTLENEAKLDSKYKINSLPLLLSLNNFFVVALILILFQTKVSIFFCIKLNLSELFFFLICELM